ncbi:MAG: Veg family protein, partial [Candidatus Fimimonas sp.]
RYEVKKIPDVNIAKQQISLLLGKNVVVKLNKGRNKVKSFKGVVQEAHSNVFVVQLSGEIFDRISCSYTDMLCGEVSVAEARTAQQC